MPMGMQIGTHLKTWRTREGLSQSDAAEKIGVKQPTISSWEAGHLPDAQSLKKIAVALGVSVDALLADAPADSGNGFAGEPA